VFHKQQRDFFYKAAALSLSLSLVILSSNLGENIIKYYYATIGGCVSRPAAINTYCLWWKVASTIAFSSALHKKITNINCLVKIRNHHLEADAKIIFSGGIIGQQVCLH